MFHELCCSLVGLLTNQLLQVIDLNRLDWSTPQSSAFVVDYTCPLTLLAL